MTPELDIALANKYSKIFCSYARSTQPRDPKDTWGFECWDGWYNLIDAVCKCLQNRADWKARSMTPEAFETYQPRAFIIKSKFGGLRFDIFGGDEETTGMIQMAEAMSYKICEHCGNAGSRKGEGWIFTLCDPCWEKKKESKL